jgi:anti-sigma regulatory factor (Ser/Thr protein kinase)
VIHFLGGPRAVGAARDAVLDYVSELATEILEDLELLVSEVVTNAVRQGGADQRSSFEVRPREEPA